MCNLLYLENRINKHEHEVAGEYVGNRIQILQISIYILTDIDANLQCPQPQYVVSMQILAKYTHLCWQWSCMSSNMCI